MKVEAQVKGNGLVINVLGKAYDINYPAKIWESLQPQIRDCLVDHLVFAITHYLPLLIGGESVEFNTRLPFFKSFIFENFLYDVLECESADQVEHLSYFKKYYNLSYKFASNESICLRSSPRKDNGLQETAILPFTFGKESLVTLGLCLELGIKPILVYCQEPVQPYEEATKLKLFRELKKEFGIEYYFIKNDTGLFRYGIEFGLSNHTELGWGLQITILCLMMIPFILHSNASYILFGNEYANNEFFYVEDWKRYPSIDQTSHIVPLQNNMIRFFTDESCQVKSSLEELDEINIYYILYNRYPKLAKYQFSCSAQKPLKSGTNWCHECYKCQRMTLFAKAINISFTEAGFDYDIFQEDGLFEHYFGDKYATGSLEELDFSFSILSHLQKKGKQDRYVNRFIKEKLSECKSWQWYIDHFTSIKSDTNLPKKYKERITNIFTEELSKFRTYLEKI